MSRDSRAAHDRLLVMVNMVHPDDWSGQGAFERGLHAAARQAAIEDPMLRLAIITVRRPGSPLREPTDGAETARLILDKGSVAGYLAHQWRLWWALVRLLWHERHADVAIYARFNLALVAAPLAALLFRRRYTTRTGPLTTFRGGRIVPTDGQDDTDGIHLGRIGRLVSRAVIELNFRVARRLLVVTPGVGETLTRRFRSVAKKWRVVENGVDLDVFRPVPSDRARWGLPDSVPVLVYTGSVEEARDFPLLFRAMAQLGDLPQPPWLLIIGDGPSMERTKASAIESGVARRVVFAGRIPQAELPSALSSSDVCVSPEAQWWLDIIGSSAMKLFEYLACDRPIVTTRAASHAFIEAERVGWLAKGGDTEDWARALRCALEDGHASPRELAVRRYSFARVFAEIKATAFDDDPESTFSC